MPKPAAQANKIQNENPPAPAGVAEELAVGLNSTIRPWPESATNTVPPLVIASPCGNARFRLARLVLDCSPNSPWAKPDWSSTVTNP